MPHKLKDTGDLMRRLQEGKLDQVLESEVPQPSFSEYIAQICIERGETREFAVRRAGIERSYGYQLFNGTRKPSRDKAIQLAIGFEMDVPQTQALLKVARQSPLAPQTKRDAAILYAILHRLSLEALQQLLETLRLPLLGK